MSQTVVGIDKLRLLGRKRKEATARSSINVHAHEIFRSRREYERDVIVSVLRIL